MDTTEKLDAVEEIKKLKARYFRFVDTKHWDDLKALFTPDARFDGESAGMGAIADRDAFLDGCKAGLTHCVSVHHGHCPEIELTSASTATGIWPMEDMLRWDENSGSPVRTLHGFGHYFEDYAKVGGDWKIASWKLTRLRVDTTPA